MVAPQSSPRISVVIPHYNGGERLHQAIRSVLAQTLQPMEIIVVDDASPHSWTLPPELAASPIRVEVLRSEQNRGAAWCRNLGVAHACGDVIAFLDADDIWLPTKLEIASAAIDKASREDTRPLVVFSNLWLCEGANAELGNASGWAGETMEDFILLEGHYVQTSTILMRRADYPAIGFDGTLRRHQDWDFAFRAQAANARFIYIDHPLSQYRRDADLSCMSRVPSAGPSLSFLRKYRSVWTPQHLSAFVIGTLIYKDLGLVDRLWVISMMLRRRIVARHGKEGASALMRLLIGPGLIGLARRAKLSLTGGGKAAASL